MKLTKNNLIQLIREALEDEQLGPDIEGGDDEECLEAEAIG